MGTGCSLLVTPRVLLPPPIAHHRGAVPGFLWTSCASAGTLLACPSMWSLPPAPKLVLVVSTM